MKTIQIKRVYDSKENDGTYRILIDRLWPRGIKKVDLKVDEWDKEIAPSPKLRTWFDHKKENFADFSKLYTEELKTKNEDVERLRTIAEKQSITLLYGAKDAEINHAVVLREFLLKKQ
ncbi:DUF488 domain-containing protein [Flavobacterium sp. IB48]|uniref:DUF488 domain-containing protein n=1 Tax=Flavobacterium sp. IB48 TaxID=2779375 RepID=UPI0018E88A69|nr:DUF488 family protein [Flavobacterium sp. IB48]MBJ2126773.1 DUF488 family protein [Flavobacterium sp. IB48]